MWWLMIRDQNLLQQGQMIQILNFAYSIGTIETVIVSQVGLVTSRAEPSSEHFELGLLIYK